MMFKGGDWMELVKAYLKKNPSPDTMYAHLATTYVIGEMVISQGDEVAFDYDDGTLQGVRFVKGIAQGVLGDQWLLLRTKHIVRPPIEMYDLSYIKNLRAIS
jgi:hypothetical protein